MLPFIPLASLIANVLMTSLGAAGVLSAPISKLITDLAGGVFGMLGSIAPGNTKIENVLAVLAGCMAILNTVKSDTSLAPEKLTLVNNMIGEVNAAITGYVIAGRGFDPTAYAPITPIA